MGRKAAWGEQEESNAGFDRFILRRHCSPRSVLPWLWPPFPTAPAEVFIVPLVWHCFSMNHPQRFTRQRRGKRSTPAWRPYAWTGLGARRSGPAAPSGKRTRFSSEKVLRRANREAKTTLEGVITRALDHPGALRHPLESLGEPLNPGRLGVFGVAGRLSPSPHLACYCGCNFASFLGGIGDRIDYRLPSTKME